MRAATPHLSMAGDNEDHTMAKSGTCVGMSRNLALWRFGFLHNSPAAKAYGLKGVSQFCWIVATRKTGKIKDSFWGMAIDMPKEFRAIIDWEPNVHN